MTRSLDTAFENALDDPVIYQAFFVHLDFDGDPAYLFNGLGQVVWNSQTWVGTGDLGSISAIEETSDGRAAGVSFQLSGIDPDLLTEAIIGDYQGREFNIYVALFLGDTYQLVLNPVLICSGEMDQMSVVDGETGTITLTGETYAANDQRKNEVRYTAEAQDLLFSGDLGLEYVEDMIDKELVWGTPSAALEATARDVGDATRSFAR